jgi:heme/copper-type cytochrome/quinol oxidase subunit 2
MRETIVRLGFAMGLAWGVAAGVARAAEPAMTFTVVNVEYEGTKIWLPATLVVKKGTQVKVKLVNNVPSDPNQHGFAIPAYGIAEVVTRGEPKTIEFTADKDGIFPINCQLHPAHVAGELVVLP